MGQVQRQRFPRTASALLAARFAAGALEIAIPQAMLQRAGEAIQ